jgi:hypothetical protein
VDVELVGGMITPDLFDNDACSCDCHGVDPEPEPEPYRPAPDHEAWGKP